jgi:prepilin-type N-terminal cleavage/methylation domain-containing protein
MYNRFMRKSTSGFTIVELLIVIVVIGILAAITIVAYNGIQGRASDTAVQSDLRQFALKVEEFNALQGRYPVGPNGTVAVEGIPRFKLARGSYSTDYHNFYYCVDNTAGTEKYAIGAVSISGKKFAYYSGQGIKLNTGTWANDSATNCTGLGISPYTYGYGYNASNGWHSWTQ